MSTGLLALLDDVAALAKVAAVTLDDVAAQATEATSNAAGIVLDDTAVTPRYVVGFSSDRELPIIAKIAVGSLKNKLLFLLPGALVLSLAAPWSVTPLLMAGGSYLCLEGFHKLADYVRPAHAHDGHDTPEAGNAPRAMTPQDFETAKVASAIRTDFILSAEIMAVTLSSVATESFWMQAVVLGVVGVAMTMLVYGAVAMIVRADDWGAALARSQSPLLVSAGRGIVSSMPALLSTLSFVGMLAMLWVGGGIIVHGLHELGVHAPEELIHHAAESAAHSLGVLPDAVEWLVTASLSALGGIALGAVIAPLEHYLMPPLRRLLATLTPKKA